MSQTDQNQNPSQHFSDQARETVHRVAETASDYGHSAAQHYVKEPTRDLIGLAKDYAKDHPDVAACWAFALGVVVGWKLKP